MLDATNKQVGDMCNAVSEAISLFSNGRDVLKGNLTKLPEALIESRRVVNSIQSTRQNKNPHELKQDSFVKQKINKVADFADEKSDAIELAMGLVSLRKDKDKVRNGTSFLVGFAASKTLEKCMDSKKGSNILNKVSEAIPKGISKVFNMKEEKAKKVVDVSKYIIAGTIYQVLSDKVGEVGSKLSENFIDKLRKTKKIA